jgi:uncharacterized protein (TIGR02453 family)
VHAPVYYLHIQPRGVFAALGIWHPDPASLHAIRERIAEKPAAWKRASRDRKLLGAFELQGDRLRRVPKGFDPGHALVEDLMWKDFIAVKELPDSFLTGADLPRRLAGLYAAGTPYMRFLCDAVGVPF